MVDFSTLMRNYSRYMLVIFNFFFVLTGVIIISIGVSVKAYYNEFDHLLDDRYFYASDLLIVVGVIIFVISFFGCCGAAKEDACLTSTFSALLIIIFILEALVGIGGILLRHKTEDLLKAELTKSMAKYNHNGSEEITKTWDAVQSQMHCCGIESYRDWYNISLRAVEDTQEKTLPLSCCAIPFGTMGDFNCSAAQHTLYKLGCLEVFGNYIRDNTSSIEIAGLTLAIIQFLGIVLSCYLAKQIRSDYETV